MLTTINNEEKEQIREYFVNFYKKNPMKDFHRNRFCIVMRQEDGEITFHDYISRPCYGEMRPYGKDSSRPEDRKPGDLRQEFPNKGEPIACCVAFMPGRMNAIKDFFNTENLWKDSLKPGEFEFYEDEGVTGVMYFYSDVDPTILVNSWLTFKRLISGRHEEYSKLIKSHSDPRAVTLAMANFPNAHSQYYLSNMVDLERVRKIKPHDLSGGLWNKRTAYNRPEVSDLYKGELNLAQFISAELGSTKTMSEAVKIVKNELNNL